MLCYVKAQRMQKFPLVYCTKVHVCNKQGDRRNGFHGNLLFWILFRMISLVRLWLVGLILLRLAPQNSKKTPTMTFLLFWSSHLFRRGHFLVKWLNGVNLSNCYIYTTGRFNYPVNYYHDGLINPV